MLVDESAITIPTMRKRIHFGECDYQDDRFVTLRRLEKLRFKTGAEIEIEFQGSNLFEGFAMARKAAMVYAGLLSQEESVHTILFVSDMGPYQGHVTGSQTPDTKQGWRIDCRKEQPKEFHINWWDRRQDTSRLGTKDKTKHYYGANFVAGGGQDLFWQVESHFPGQVEPKKRR